MKSAEKNTSRYIHWKSFTKNVYEQAICSHMLAEEHTVANNGGCPTFAKLTWNCAHTQETKYISANDVGKMLHGKRAWFSICVHAQERKHNLDNTVENSFLEKSFCERKCPANSKASPEIIPERLRTKHATSEFYPTNQP